MSTCRFAQERALNERRPPVPIVSPDGQWIALLGNRYAMTEAELRAECVRLGELEINASNHFGVPIRGAELSSVFTKPAYMRASVRLVVARWIFRRFCVFRIYLCDERQC